MSMTDPIADMLTRIRNAVRVERPHIEMPLSKVKRGLADATALCFQVFGSMITRAPRADRSMGAAWR